MQTFNRRRLFTLLGAGALIAATGGCATSREGSATTIVLNVGKINAYLEATLNSANTILTILSQVPGMEKGVGLASEFIEQLTIVSSEFNKVSEGKVTIEYNTESVRTITDSILALFMKLSTFIGSVIVTLIASPGLVPGSTLSRVQLINNALKTVISVLKAILYQAFAQVDPANEVKALRTLNA